MVRRLLWREGENISRVSCATTKLSCILWHFVWIIVLKPASARARAREELLRNYLSSPRGHVSPPVISPTRMRYPSSNIQIVKHESLIIYSIFFKAPVITKKLLDTRLSIETIKRLLLIVTKKLLISYVYRWHILIILNILNFHGYEAYSYFIRKGRTDTSFLRDDDDRGERVRIPSLREQLANLLN